MPRSDTHPSLCPHHSRQEEKKRNDDPAALAVDLLGPVQEFYTAMSVNYVIGRLFVLLASDRIPPRKAAVLAYISQLLLQSQRDVKSEITAVPPELSQLVRHIYAVEFAKLKAEGSRLWDDSSTAPSSPSSVAASSPSPGPNAVCDSI